MYANACVYIYIYIYICTFRRLTSFRPEFHPMHPPIPLPTLPYPDVAVHTPLYINLPCSLRYTRIPHANPCASLQNPTYTPRYMFAPAPLHAPTYPTT